MSTNKNDISDLPQDDEQQHNLNTDVDNQNDQLEEFQSNNATNNLNTNIDEMINNHITDNSVNNDDTHPENISNKQITNQNPELKTVKSNSGKKVAFDSKCSPNIPFNEEVSNETKSKIEEFRSKFQSKDYLIFLRKDDFYEVYKNENCFTILDRTSKVTTRPLTPDGKRQISHTNSLIFEPQKNDELLKAKRTKSQNYTQYKNTDRLSQMKKFYITHLYKKIPDTFEYQYLADKIDVFSKLNTFSLARFYCYSMTNSEGIFIPEVLTERPVNGPLLTFFEKVKNNRQPTSDNIGTINFDSYNIDLTEVNSEKKFILIAGITYAIYFIHSKYFIHSNLNPMTVYIDEYYHPKVSDYIFVPPFHITSHLDESRSYSNIKRYKYTYSINKDEFDLNAFDNHLYVAPEIKNFEPNKNTNDFGAPIDIYSLGLTIFFILTEKEATFDTEGNLQYPSEFSAKWKELIEKCIDKDPSKRPSAEFIINNFILNETERNSLISSISNKPTPSENSIELARYLPLLNQKNSYLNIINDMIPAIYDLDDETIELIQAAEREDIDCLIKVGDYFLEGSHKLYQDYVWARTCYQLAHKKMKEGDERKRIVEEKIKQINKKAKTLTLKIISNEITKENILEKLKITENVENIEEEKVEEEEKRKINITFVESRSIYKTMERLIGFDNIESLIDTKELIRKRNQFDPLSNKLREIKPGEYYKKKAMNAMKDKDVLLCRKRGDKVIYCYRIYRKNDNKPFFAKVYTIQSIDRYSINIFKREAILPSELNHPAIVKYVGYCEFDITSNKPPTKHVSEFSLTLVQEFLPNGDLEKMIKKPKKAFNPTNKLKIIIGIASGMNYLFEHHIIHRDLKPENIILNENFEPVICDFEYARHFNKSKNVQMTTTVGTPIHEAPEVLASCNYYTSEIDSYSFGVIVYQIMSNTDTDHVYADQNGNDLGAKLNDAKNSNDYMLSKIEHLKLSRVLFELITSCWNAEFDGRPDPPTIYKKLLDAVYSGEVIIEGANMEAVKEYINRLESQSK